MKKKIIIFAFAILLILGSIIIITQRGIEVQLETITPTAMTDNYTEKGIVQIGQRQTIITAVSGALTELAVQQNDFVHAGDVIARIDSQPLLYQKTLHQNSLAAANSQLEQARISQVMTTTPSEYLHTLQENLAAAQKSYDLAQAQADAQNQLYAAGAVSQFAKEQAEETLLAAEASFTQAQERYQASQEALTALTQIGISSDELNHRFQQTTLEQLQAQIAAENASLAELDRQIADCTIIAATDGYITAVPAKGLSHVQAGQVIATMNSTTHTTVQCDILTTVEPYLTIGTPVTLTQTLRGQDRTFAGYIQDIDQFAQTTTSALGLAEYRVRVTIAVDDSDNQLKDGYQLEAHFTLYETDNALIVPNSALFQEDDQYYLFIAHNHRAQKIPVTIGHQSTTQTVILTGISSNQQIIRNANTENLTEGARIRARR